MSPGNVHDMGHELCEKKNLENLTDPRKENSESKFIVHGGFVSWNFVVCK